ncbi:hypothetical protein GGR50DRAFT_681073 [Xylaria sp. CBS 124048]|nr:hypothetical protein GGR50DRAFT_681073 [Xylaria sp. CBS 124048]
MGAFQVAGPVITTSLKNASRPVPAHGATSRSDPVLDTPAGLPGGYPSRLCHPFAWNKTDFADDESKYIYILSEEDEAELRQAKDDFKEQELDGDQVDRDNFPLPTLGPRLEALGRDLYDGKGFHVVRGLDPSRYSVEDLVLIRLGIQAYIADKCGRQDHRGNMLVHIVADNSSEIKLGHHRHSTSAISFHNEEAGDVISWMTRGTSKTGGRCILAPVYTIYNILAAHRPDIIRTLTKSDWPIAYPKFQCRPLMFYHDSKLIMNFGRTPLLGSATHPRPEHLPQPNERQREALDLVEAIARALQMEIKTRSGDMHFINNFTILHRREGFVNGASPDEKRHLVRMRLRDSRIGWSIPDPLRQEWTDAFGRTGPKTWHLEPMPGDAFPLRKYTN